MLRQIFRTWSISVRENLSVRLRQQGFLATQPGNHISARVQESILVSACLVDARVALLEILCVRITVHRGRMGAVRE